MGLEIAIALIWHQGKLLIAQRPEGTHLAGYWEFPGGKREPGESLEETLHREVHEELGIAVRILRALPPIRYRYPDRGVVLHPFECALNFGKPKPLQAQAWRWVFPHELCQYRFPPANQNLLKALASRNRP